MIEMALRRVSVRCKGFGLMIFLVGFFVRLLPEFFSGIYPVGYDLLAGYAPSLYVFPDDAPLKLFGWAWSPLAVYVLWVFWRLSGVDLFLFLKVASPVFYGFFVSSFYYMLLKGVGWSEKKSFVTALVFLLQPAVLRTGWDQLREELGFVFLFVLLAETRLDLVGGAKARSFMVFVLSVLVVFSHQLAAVLLFVVMGWQFMGRLVRDKGLFLKELIVFLPSVFVFVWGIYGQFVSPSFSDYFVPIQLPSGTGFFAFSNYFLSDPRFIGGDWFRVLAYVGSLSLYCVLPLVPFAVKGFFGDNVFTPMLVWLCVASFSVVVFPWFAFAHYWWWILLLPIPLTVYAGKGLDRFGVLADGKRSKKLFVGLLMLSVVEVGYACSAVRLGYPYAYSYIPTGLVESCVDIKDIPDIKEAFMWANMNLPENATVVVPEKFQGFAFMYSNAGLKIRVSPALLDFEIIVEKIGEKNDVFYAIFFLNEAKTLENISILATIGRVGVYEIDFSP